MVDAIHQGRLKALYLMGEEMSLVDSNANYVGEAFAKLEFFVVQDIFFSATCQYADVVLPAAPSLEKEGTFTSTERRIQRLYQVFEPLAGSRPDWRITQDIANRMGAGWRYEHPSEIMREIAALTPLMAGVTYDRLEDSAAFSGLSPPMAPASRCSTPNASPFRMAKRGSSRWPGRRRRSSPTSASTCT